MRPDSVLPEGARRLAAAGAAVCVVLVVGLAAYTRGRRQTPVDDRVDDLLRGTAERFGPALERVVETSPPQRVLLGCLLLAGVLVVRGRRRAAALCVVGPALALVVARLGQDLADRPSATVAGSYDAFPSGHMAGAAALLALVVLLTAQAGSSAWALGLRAAATLLAALMALALTAQRHHFVTDVVGGAAVAFGAVLLTALVVDRRR